MAAPKSTIWTLDPHTRAKHAILQRYLEAWTPVLTLGGFPEIAYFDGFAGPGRYSEGEDGSPIIALKSVLAHKDRINKRVTLIFVEKDEERAAVLQSIVESMSLPTNFAVTVEAGKTFEQAFNEFRTSHASRSSRWPPTFAFIDPFGWTGAPFRIVETILGHASCEVFVTFMYEEINRFIDHKDQVENFNSLFGSDAWQQCRPKQGVSERRRCLHDAYIARLKTAARFVRSFEMRNRSGRTDYFLFYATNNVVGLKKMKEAMWKVDRSGEFSFSDATDPNQAVLFGDEPRFDLLLTQIVDRFKGREVSVEEIELFVLSETAFRETHYKQQILKRLEFDDPPQIQIVGAPASRRRGTFGDPQMRVRFI